MIWYADGSLLILSDQQFPGGSELDSIDREGTATGYDYGNARPFLLRDKTVVDLASLSDPGFMAGRIFGAVRTGARVGVIR